VRIPVCVVRFILSICPSDDDQYTGHCDIEGEGGDDNNNEEEDDLVNTSFHEIKEEASPKIVHFEEGQSIPLSLYFKSSQYSVEHVRQVRLFLNLQSKDGRYLIMRSYLPQPRTSAKTNTPIRHCACFALEKQRIVLSSQLPLSMRTIK
jgi:hypothetical protein